jgi:hypothetical protein
LFEGGSAGERSAITPPLDLRQSPSALLVGARAVVRPEEPQATIAMRLDERVDLAV